MSTASTLFDYEIKGLPDLIQLLFAVAGLAWTIVRVYNAVADGLLDRKLKEIEIEVGLRELEEEEYSYCKEEEDEDDS